MAALQKFNSFAQDLLLARFNFSTHAFRLGLTSTPPSATNTLWTGAGGVTGTGYTAGGGVLAVTLVPPTGGVSKVTIADYTFTATGTWTAFRYGVIYSNETASKYLVGWFDHGASITLSAGETFKADFDAANGVFTLA